ncbi:DUF397 domain-containing protein [Streptomyces abikoensis]|uniref:DUF397 domain-containing protein n=1 Tax=Streptomyces abikoensis TaxID=97398 RepID=UPI0033DC0A7D
MKPKTRFTALQVADKASWFKSSHSTDTGAASCVAVARLADCVGIRDSKEPDGPAFIVAAAAWTSFIGEVRAGRLLRGTRG